MHFFFAYIKKKSYLCIKRKVMNKVIEKWKLNKGLLAEKMNMPLGTFCNKLSPKHTSKFSDAEIITLKLVLREMNADIADAIEIDFNDALTAIINKQK